MAACTKKGTIVADNQKRIPALFCQSRSAKQPVREWLMKLDIADRKTIGTDIKTVKKSQKTPKQALDLALDRKSNVEAS